MSVRQSNSPDTVALLTTLGQASELCRRLELLKEAATFERFACRFQKESPTYEVLQKELGDATNGMTALRILTKLGNDHSEFHRLQDAFYRVLFPENDKESSESSLEARVDKHGDEIMESSSKAEAREWMGQPSHVFFKNDARVIAKFVEEFYGAGAKQVMIVDIEEHDGVQYGEALLIVLPKKAAARTKLFEIGSRAETDFQNDPVTDKGQKYLYYSLD